LVFIARQSKLTLGSTLVPWLEPILEIFDVSVGFGIFFQHATKLLRPLTQQLIFVHASLRSASGFSPPAIKKSAYSGWLGRLFWFGQRGFFFEWRKFVEDSTRCNTLRFEPLSI